MHVYIRNSNVHGDSAAKKSKVHSVLAFNYKGGSISGVGTLKSVEFFSTTSLLSALPCFHMPLIFGGKEIDDLLYIKCMVQILWEFKM